jgi:hypothetical protein
MSGVGAQKMPYFQEIREYPQPDSNRRFPA